MTTTAVDSEARIAEIRRLQQTLLAQIRDCQRLSDLEGLRLAALGRKGSVTRHLKSLGALPAAERPQFGRLVNEARQAISAALAARRRNLEEAGWQALGDGHALDVTLPGRGQAPGGLHPVTQVLERIVRLFADVGFEVVDGPEVEDEYHNFEALNIPAEHPARAMHDTFYFADGRLLRTHTSSVQMRLMDTASPPLRCIAPGRVYRHDSDMTHSPMFHQVEGLLIEQDVSFADLKGLLSDFLEHFFEWETLQLRFRPSYFPFTSPSAEMDIRIAADQDWLEVLGCGMVHPEVLQRAGIEPDRHSGLAFGIGVERLAMLYYGIDDLRVFFANDLRFLRQFN